MKEFLKKFDFKKILNFLDSLVAKIPESVASLLKFLFFACLIGAGLYGISYGWQFGKGKASQSGQELAKDTRTLFRVEIEKDYNRKRKDIRMPSSEDLLDDTDYKPQMEYEFYNRTAPINSELIDSDRRLLERKSLRNLQDTDSKPILYEIGDEELEQYNMNRPETEINKESMPAKETDNENKILERKKIDFSETKPKIEKKEDTEKSLPFPIDNEPIEPSDNIKLSPQKEPDYE